MSGKACLGAQKSDSHACSDMPLGTIAKAWLSGERGQVGKKKGATFTEKNNKFSVGGE